MQRILVVKERAEGETRVAATPETVAQLIKLGFSVTVEAGAGSGAFIDDAAYEEAGATVSPEPAVAEAAAVLCVRAPSPGAVAALGAGTLLVGLVDPLRNREVVEAATAAKVQLLAMELVPRITRAQSMDALSSQANIAGYKAVLLAAAELPRYFPLLMTAAGTVKPAKVVVMGAGVAGLQAIATARRLGAVVEGTDIRPAVKEQVESLGAKFIEPPELDGGEDAGGYAREVGADYLKRQQEVVAEHIAVADVVITTALVPGRAAPKLISAELVGRMKAGSVIVDLAVEAGGNCELTEPGVSRHHGVTIVGHPNLPATLPKDASALYARNVLALLKLLGKEGTITLDRDDEIVAGSLVTFDGQLVHERVANALGLASATAAPAADDAAQSKEGASS